MNAKERFLRYVTYYTTSDEESDSSPSSARQKKLGHELMDEMKELELVDVHMDESGNVLGTLSAFAADNIPVLALIAHMDTSPDASGENVSPRILRYEGGDIWLSDDVCLNEKLCPGLSDHIGENLIVTDGKTLLGADDKAGIAEIMTALELLIKSKIPHGELRVIFTTDEEIGRGSEGIDTKGLGCDYGYTVDGGPLGEIEYENFNAASAVLNIKGIGVHPGSAKNIMVNAAAAAAKFHCMLPENEVPEKTEGYEGFFHLHDIKGNVSEASLQYIIRDHDSGRFARRKELFLELTEELNRIYGDGTAKAEIRDSYYNMKEKIIPHMHLIDRAKKAFEKNGVKPVIIPIRGGTDGAVFSWQGLPCPNLSTGGYNFHGVREWIPVKSLEIMSNVIVDIVCGFVE